MTAFVLVLGFGVLAFLLARIEAAVVRLSTPAEPSEQFTTLYPVFSERQIPRAMNSARESTRQSERLEARVLSEKSFKEETRHNQISEGMSGRMLGVTNTICESEQGWFWHSIMMDANLAVLTGRMTREQTLAEAFQRSEIIKNRYQTDADAIAFRDHWKRRLEDPSLGLPDPPRRPYSNPWHDREHDVWRAKATLEDVDEDDVEIRL